MSAKGLTVDSDTNEVTNLLNLATSKASWSQVPENEVVVSALSLELVPRRYELAGERLGVGDNLKSVLLPCRA